MITQPLQLWKSQITIYEKMVEKCVNKLSKPIGFIPPADLDLRIQRLSQLLVNNYQTQYQHVDVVLYFIEGQKNKTIMQLASQLQLKFGKELKYWQDRIYIYANYENYSENMSIWEVKKEYEPYLYLTPQIISNLRKFRRITKIYLGNLRNLIKIIKKVQNNLQLPKIDQAFKKFKNAEQKYYAYIQEVQINPNQDYGEYSNASLAARKNAKKTLFHFMNFKSTANNTQQAIPPLTKYNFFIHQNNSKRLLAEEQQLRQKKALQLNKYLQTIHYPIITIDQLRKQCLEEGRYSKSGKKQQKQNQTTYVSIYDSCYYFSYSLYPNQNTLRIDFTNPFKQYPQIIYDIDSQDEYNQILGDDIKSNDERSLESDEVSHKSFMVSDGHLSDDQENKRQLKIQFNNFQNGRWEFSKGNQVQGYEMVMLYQLPIVPNNILNDPTDEQLGQIVHGKIKKNILQSLQQSKLVCSKQRLEEFLKKNCRKLKSGRKTIYKVIGYNYHQEIPEIIIENNAGDEDLSNSKSKHFVQNNSNQNTFDKQQI